MEDWQNQIAFRAWLVAALYASTDEWHQSFVRSREGSVWDVLLDSVGVFLGLCVVRRICRWRSARALNTV
jgi:VanZ family protein